MKRMIIWVMVLLLVPIAGTWGSEIFPLYNNLYFDLGEYISSINVDDNSTTLVTDDIKNLPLMAFSANLGWNGQLINNRNVFSRNGEIENPLGTWNLGFIIDFGYLSTEYDADTRSWVENNKKYKKITIGSGLSIGQYLQFYTLPKLVFFNDNNVSDIELTMGAKLILPALVENIGVSAGMDLNFPLINNSHSDLFGFSSTIKIGVVYSILYNEKTEKVIYQLKYNALALNEDDDYQNAIQSNSESTLSDYLSKYSEIIVDQKHNDEIKNKLDQMVNDRNEKENKIIENSYLFLGSTKAIYIPKELIPENIISIEELSLYDSRFTRNNPYGFEKNTGYVTEISIGKVLQWLGSNRCLYDISGNQVNWSCLVLLDLNENNQNVLYDNSYLCMYEYDGVYTYTTSSNYTNTIPIFKLIPISKKDINEKGLVMER